MRGNVVPAFTCPANLLLDPTVAVPVRRLLSGPAAREHRVITRALVNGELWIIKGRPSDLPATVEWQEELGREKGCVLHNLLITIAKLDRLHLFVKQKVSGLFVYLGEAAAVNVSGSQPFTVPLALPRARPDEVQRRLALGTRPGVSA